ncbi:Microtubule-associated protein, microtubule dynamics during spindle orientation [Tulasnella sp. JGI-2019a]|nr:Microtubule-associated protein, microtubule dynamics during spindle orientation [Tulasnella sp. JGI-2019a]
MDGPPPPEEDFSTIPILDRIVHKNWKARLHGYEALPKLFSLTTSDSDPAFRPYLSDPDLLKKIVTDSNAVAQEKGVEAVCALIEYSGENSAKTRGVVVPALVDKCLGSTRAGTKTKAIELILKYIGVENNGEGAVRDLLPGLAAKQPKVVSGTVTAMNEAFKAFGIKIIPPKEALKTLPKIFGHQDKNVRAEGTALVQTLYTWLGPGIQPFLSDLKPVQVKELGDSFEALDKESAGQGTGKQTRWTRVQQREREAAEAAGDAGGDADEAEAEVPPDPRLLMDEVDITPKLPANFYTDLASSKWKERKEALDATLEIVKANPRIKDVDSIGELAKALAGRMTDANIQCVMTAAQIIGGLAEGIGQPFGKHRGSVVPPMLDRFKERKQNVVDAIGQGLDAVFETVTFPDVTEFILTTLKSKNPQVKEGTAKFLARCLSTTKVPPAKGDIKPIAETLVGLLEDSFEPVRAAAADSLGSLLKIVGERQLNPFLDPLDDLRKTKVKEASEKATVKCKAGGAPPPKPAAPSAPPKAVKKAAPAPSASDELMNDFDSTPKAKPPARLLVKKVAALAVQEEDELKENLEPPRAALPSRFAKQAESASDEPEAASSKPAAKVPARLLTKKPPAVAAPSATPAAKKLPPPASGGGAPPKSGGAAPASEPVKYKHSSEDADALAAELVPAQIAADLGDANWKIRLAALEEFNTWLEEVVETADCEVLFRFLSKRPGWNEKNFQVSAKVYGAMSLLAERCPSFSKSCVAISTSHLSEKLGDVKLKKPAGDLLLLFSEKTSLSLVLSQAYDTLSKQKAPKVLADSITWIGQALTDFGIAGLSLRSLVDFLKEGLKNSNAAVRSSATNTLVTLRLFAGAGIKDLLQDLNPQLLATIDTEFSKVDGQTPPVPTRFSADIAATTTTGKGRGAGADALDELFPRVDLDKLLTGTSILADAKSESWKTRKEALELLQSILDVGANKRLKPNMGDIGQVLKARVGDSNKTVQVLALDIICRIASGMNKPFEKYTRFLARPIAEVLADQKSTIRVAGTTALTAMATACEGIDSMINPLAAALEAANPLLRSSLLNWMAEWFTTQQESTPGLDLSPWVSPVVNCLDDKSGDVRKGAQAVLPVLIMHVGIDSVMAQTNSLKPASRSSVIPMIQTAAKKVVKPNAPAPAASAARVAKVQSPALPAADSPAEPFTSQPTATKRPATNLRMRPIEPSSRSESRAESIREVGPSGSKINGGTKPNSSRAASTIPPSSPDSCPFIGTSLDAKRARLAKDGARWVVESLPVPKDLGEVLLHQMERCTSKDLLGSLFSKDHNAVNAFVKGLGIISDSYSQVSDDDDDTKTILIANSDLAFKYVSTKIHEPQPNLIGRCLDVLDSVIALLTACDYTINDQEALCFIPTIIHKLGDGRETVRVRVQNIMHNLPKVYPSSRLFQLAIDHGLKSKIAKTRQGALEEMGNILRRVGISACEPTKAFPIIGSLIGDKDPSVRKAALSTIGEGYVLAGEKIWQFVGALSPKDKTQLEERLKRTSGPSKPPTPPTKDKAEPPVIPQVARLANGIGRPGSPSLSPRGGGIPRPASPALSLSTRAGAGSPNDHGGRTAQRTPSPQPTIKSPSPSSRPRSFLPSRFGQPRSRLNPAGTGSQSGLQPSSHADGVEEDVISSSNSTEFSNGVAGPNSSEGATIIISSILSSDPSRSVDALKKIQKILDLPPGDDMPNAFKELADHADGLIETIVLQMSHVFERPEEVAEPGNFRLAKHLIQTLNSFCDHAVLAESLPVEILTSLLEELTMRLLQTDESPDANVKDLSKFINMIVLRIFATGRRISVFRSLFALLLQITKPFPHNGTTAESKDAKLAELVLKCVWKMARTIPQELNKGTLSAVELFPAIEQFLQSIPPNEWRQRAQNRVPVGDMPLRTTKVIIQHIVAVYPDQVYDQLSEAFDDPSATIVYPYVYRILNTTPTRPAQDDRAPTHTGGSSASARSLSPTSSSRQSPPIEGSRASTQAGGRRDASLFGGGRATAYGEASEPDPDARLNEIIDHISSDTTGAMHKEGITELHHFIKEYPHKKARVDHMLDTTGPAFRKYIARALASRAAEDEEREVAVADTLSKLESAKRPGTSIGMGHPTSLAKEASATAHSRRISVGGERRFSTASEAPPGDDKVLSRLHDIFQYQGRSSISSSNPRRISGEPLF